MKYFWFNIHSIFFKYHKFIPLYKAMLLIDQPKYVVVEFVKSKKDNDNHFPNALQINILQYEDCLKLIHPNQTILLNNDRHFGAQYYRFLKDHNYKVFFIKQSRKD